MGRRGISSERRLSSCSRCVCVWCLFSALQYDAVMPCHPTRLTWTDCVCNVCFQLCNVMLQCHAILRSSHELIVCEMSVSSSAGWCCNVMSSYEVLINWLSVWCLFPAQRCDSVMPCHPTRLTSTDCVCDVCFQLCNMMLQCHAILRGSHQLIVCVMSVSSSAMWCCNTMSSYEAHINWLCVWRLFPALQCDAVTSCHPTRLTSTDCVHDVYFQLCNMTL